jgi:hypothetical protein
LEEDLHEEERQGKLEREWILVGTTYLAHVHIKGLEPLPELFILIRIVDQALAASKMMSMLCPLAKRSRSVRSSVVAVLRPPSCARYKYRGLGEKREDLQK